MFLSVASCSGTSNHSPLPYLLKIITHCAGKQIVPGHIIFIFETLHNLHRKGFFDYVYFCLPVIQVSFSK